MIFTDLTKDCKQSDRDATLGARTEPQESSLSIPLSASDSTASDQPDHAAPDRSTTPSEPNGITDEARLNDPRLTQTLPRRKSYASGHEGEDWVQIERLISRMFGHERNANSEEEKTRHAAVVWKNLTVRGVGLGTALQPTNRDIFLGLPRLIGRLLTRGRKGTGARKPEIRTILGDFTVCHFQIWRRVA